MEDERIIQLFLERSEMAIKELPSDGVYVYSCAPWEEAQIQWKLVYDENGKPAAMQLIDKNIRD